MRLLRLSFVALSLLAAPSAWADLSGATVSFSPASIGGGSTSTLTITMANSPPGNPNNMAFTASYPANLFNAATPAATTDCGTGTVTAAPGGTSVSLSGGRLTGNSTCTVTVEVTSCNAGTYNVGGFQVTSTAGNVTASSGSLTVTGNSPADAAQSSVTAAPASVPANGATASTITVTVRSPCGTPLSGKTVTLGQGGGSSSITPASAVTNASGVATFTVTNTTPQTVTYTATVTTDSVVITQTAAVTFTQITAPTVSKSFSPTATGTNLSSTLSITITNPNAAGSIVGLAFTDTYPGTLVNAATPGLSNTCGGTATGNAGANQLTLSGGTLAAGASCTVSVSVTSATANLFNNSSGTVTSTNAANGTASSATLRINNRPTVTKSFSPTSVGIGLPSTLTVTISNSNTVAITGVAFTDTYPGALVNHTTPGLTNSCGGTATGNAGANQLTLTGGTVPASGSCTVTVSVRSPSAGTFNNSTGTVTSTNAGSGTAASATLTVNAAPGVAKSFTPASISTGQTSTLTVTLTNTNGTPTTGVSFTDNYPVNLVNAATPGLVNTCGGTATANAGGTSLSLASGTIPAASSCTVSVSVTSSATGSYNNSTGSVTTTNAGSGGPGTAILTVGVSVSSFNVVEPGGHPVTGRIFTKIAGQDIAVDIVARDASNNVATSFTGTVAVELVDNTSGGACAGLPLIKALANQTFTAPEAGRHPLSAGQFEANAWRNVLFRVKFPVASPTVTSCSSDAFANRPQQFVNVLVRDLNRTTAGTTRTLNNTSNPGTGTVHNAGRPFRVDATAQNGAGTPATTTLYSPTAGQPLVILSQCGAGAVCPAALGTLTPGAWSAAAGVITTSTASYSEVGAFNLVLQDQTFSSVDDPDGTATSVRYISSAPVTVGRFVPDHFTLAAGATITPRTDIGACAGSSFTYMDERMDLGFTLTAREAGGAVTPGYAGATLGALVLNSAASYGFGAIDSAAPTPLSARLDLGMIPGIAASWTAGTTGAITAPIAVSRAAAGPDGPYAALRIGIAPSDPDGVTLLGTALNLDADNDATPERAQVGPATAVRFGRLVLQSLYGPSNRDLPVTLEAQYWDGASPTPGFTRNNADSCTPFVRSDFALAFTAGANLVACETAMQEANLTLASGRATITMLKPGAGNEGTVQLTANLGSLGGNYCPSVGAAELPATNAGKAYLLGRWDEGAAYDDKPRASAGFGLFGAQPKNFIFFRENF